MLHLSTSLNPVSLLYEIYIHYGKGSPGLGWTPTESILDWIAKLKGYCQLYKEKNISIGRFGQVMGISLEEAKELLKDQKIPLYLVPDSIQELIEDTSNA